MIVRPYTPEDRPVILGHLIDFQNYEKAIEPDWKPGCDMADGYLDYLLDQAASCNGKFLLADIDGEVAGYICFWTEANDTSFQYSSSQVRLCDVYVSPKHRSQGVGKVLISEVEKYAKETGQDIFLDVLAGNTSARAVYNKIGFVEQEIVMKKVMR